MPDPTKANLAVDIVATEGAPSVVRIVIGEDSATVDLSLAQAARLGFSMIQLAAVAAERDARGTAVSTAEPASRIIV